VPSLRYYPGIISPLLQWLIAREDVVIMFAVQAPTSYILAFVSWGQGKPERKLPRETALKSKKERRKNKRNENGFRLRIRRQEILIYIGSY